MPRSHAVESNRSRLERAQWPATTTISASGHCRKRRPKKYLLGDRPEPRGASYDSGDAERAAGDRPHDGARGGLHPHERQRLSSAAAVCKRHRSRHGCAPNPALGGTRWLLREQRPDDGLQRTSDSFRSGSPTSTRSTSTIRLEKAWPPRAETWRPTSPQISGIRRTSGITSTTAGQRKTTCVTGSPPPPSSNFRNSGTEPLIKGALGGWQIFGILTGANGPGVDGYPTVRNTGSRPDIVPGVDMIVANWNDTCDARGCNYLNPAAFTAVPVSPTTNATLRPGTYMVGDARGPALWNLNATLAKNFALGAGKRLQIRADALRHPEQEELGRPDRTQASAINASDFGRITAALGSKANTSWGAAHLLIRLATFQGGSWELSGLNCDNKEGSLLGEKRGILLFGGLVLVVLVGSSAPTARGPQQSGSAAMSRHPSLLTRRS